MDRHGGQGGSEPVVLPAGGRGASRRGGAGVLLLLLVLALLAPDRPLALDPTRGLGQYVHDRFTDRQGLPQNAVRAVLRSRRGELWIGTDEGVARFDGARFITYDRRSSPALGSNLVYHLAEDASGAVWIGTFDAGLYRLEAGVVAPARLSTPLPGQQITALLDDGKGTLWIGTRDGLARLSGGELTVFGPAEGLPDPQVRSLALLRDGRLLIGTRQGAAFLSDGRLSPGPRELAAERIASVVEDPALGDLWFATEGRGLARLTPGGRLAFLGAGQGVPASLTQVFLDRDGGLWLAADEGLLRLVGDRAERFVAPDGAEGPRVWAIAEDREGNLWVGSEGGGLERFRDGDFVTLGVAEGLPHDFATALLQDRAGDLWIGTLGGLAVAPGGDPRRLRSVLRGKRGVLSLADDQRGTLWVGFIDGGLGRVRGGVLEQVVPPSAARGVSALAVAPDGTLLAGTFLGLFRLEGAALVPVRDSGLPPDARLNALAWAPDGALWAGLEFQGAFRRPPGGRFERVAGGPPAGKDVNDFLFDRDGTVWFGTLGAGLWRWRDGHAQGVTTQAGLHDDVIWRILDDGRGHLWLTCNKGLFRVDRGELQDVLGGRAVALTSLAYGVGDGMRSRECNGAVQPAGWRTSDGRLWVPTVKGVAFVDPERLKQALSPPVVIDGVAIDGLEQPAPASLALSPGTSRVAVRYSALSFSSPERVRFRLRLEGQDPDWVDAADERLATYTNLAPGRYRLIVQARVGAGHWGAPAELLIEQRPTLAQSTWSWVLGAGLLLAAAGLALATRARRLHRREAELRAGVELAMADFRRAQGLLPVCGVCQKVQDHDGAWKGIEAFLRDRGAEAADSVRCPDCRPSASPITDALRRSQGRTPPSR